MLVQQIRQAMTTLNDHRNEAPEFTSLSNPLRPGEKAFEAWAQNITPGAYRVFWCCGPAKRQITIVAIPSHP